jgi:hypothetical protein
VVDEASGERSEEVARLRAERDELRSEIDRLRGRRHREGRARGAAAGVLVVLACVSLLAALPGVWARRTILDTGRFVDRVEPLADDPAVQEALTVRITDQLMTLIDPRSLFEEALPERGQLLGVPLTNAVEGFVADRVERFVRSERFEQLWVGAATVAHATAVEVLQGESDVVTAQGGQVALNLIPVIDAVLAEITSLSPEILGRERNLPELSVDDLPEAAIARIEAALDLELDEDFGQLTVYEDSTLATAQEAVKTFDRVVVLLLPVTMLFAALALWASTHRRRTLLQLTAGVALVTVVVRRMAFAVEAEIAALPPTELGRRAAAVVGGTFLAPLTTLAVWTLSAAALVAAAAILSGPYPWAASLRRRALALALALAGSLASATSDRARDEGTQAWIREHRDLLVTGGAAAGFAVLWVADLSWLGLLLVVAAVAVFVASVDRIARSSAATASDGTLSDVA